MSMFIGYHGTKSSIAKNIIRTNFTFNQANPGWLGSGNYFFEENERLANYWGNLRNPGNYSVIRAEINVPEEKKFDISDPNSDHSKEFHAMRDVLLPTLIQQNLKVKANSTKDFDGKILNVVCRKGGYQLVRAYTYTYNDQDRTDGTFSRFPNGVELCLKNTGYIVNKNII
ncbi:hypothetical protein [Peribacillus simplex]|uniref:hypothetical protein n=1 Tax=Peribacillus simplex TaxID=1478 RepID=UPI003D2750A3